FSVSVRRPPVSALFPYTTLFRSSRVFPLRPGTAADGKPDPSSVRPGGGIGESHGGAPKHSRLNRFFRLSPCQCAAAAPAFFVARSEEHTSELQSRSDLVCRLLLE